MQTNTAVLLTPLLVRMVVVTTLAGTCFAITPDYAVPPPCDINNKPDIGDLDVNLFEGKWYMKMVTTVIPQYANLTGYETDVVTQSGFLEGQVLLDLHVKRTFSDMAGCSGIEWMCHLDGATCSAVGFQHTFDIVAIDYQTAFAMWSETEVGSKTYPIFSIYVRDPYSEADMSGIQPEVEQFCGAQATSSRSIFYRLCLSYVNVPACFHAGPLDVEESE